MCGTYRGRGVHHLLKPQGAENLLASTGIKSECPGHPGSEFETCLELKDFPARQNQLYTILYIALVSIMGCSFKDLIVPVHNIMQASGNESVTCIHYFIWPVALHNFIDHFSHCAQPHSFICMYNACEISQT